MAASKIEAKHLLPLVLDFAEQFLSENDFEVLKGQLKDEESASNYKQNILVKKGGLKQILSCYFTHNKAVYKTFLQEMGDSNQSDDEVEQPPAKRQRTQSNVSARSVKSTQSNGSAKGKASKKAASKEKNQAKETGVTTRRKSSGEWQPTKIESNAKAQNFNFKFQRIDETKF